METSVPSPPEELKYLILNCNEPFVLKGYLNWKILKWSLDEWKSVLKKEKLVFRCGKNLYTKEPQWERTTTIKDATFDEFLLLAKTKSENWMYFDYKHLGQWLKNIKELKKHISWSSFGFSNLSSKESTIWIGSPGAHTSCHADTYGCNLVAQVYGRKQWLLCPPEEDLKPTRIPYEESSIYSQLNFFSPDLADFKGVKNCRRVILEPGDVLFVPHKWWHYVENLDVAISVNTWIPLPTDDEERLKESLVQLFISQMTKNIDNDLRKLILNPNFDEEISDLSFNTSLNLVDKCKSMLMKSKSEEVDENVEIKMDGYFENWPFLQKIPTLTDEEFSKFLKEQRNRFGNADNAKKDRNFEELYKLINAFTHPDTVLLVKNKLMS